jgi:hypothetical protein
VQKHDVANFYIVLSKTRLPQMRRKSAMKAEIAVREERGFPDGTFTNVNDRRLPQRNAAKAQ